MAVSEGWCLRLIRLYVPRVSACGEPTRDGLSGFEYLCGIKNKQHPWRVLFVFGGTTFQVGESVFDWLLFGGTTFRVSESMFVWLVFGGDGGIRNRVRKFILSAFYERIRYIKSLPLHACRQAYIGTAPLCMTGYGDACPFTFTANRRLILSRSTLR